MPLKASYLLVAGVGGIIVLAGIKGWGISSTLRDVLSGNAPGSNPTLANQITPSQYATQAFQQSLNTLGPAGTTGGGAGGLVGLAEANPLPYKWGGAPANGATDCSGWVNWIVGTLAGLSIPGNPNGQFKGNSHGPNTLVWLAWCASGGMSSIPGGTEQGGDLVIWQSHMGIVTAPGQMISDLNPSLGTQQTSIAGAAPPGEVSSYWRFR